jgi:hypothetical protein
MIAEAQRLHPNLALSCANVLDLPETPSYDVVNANGIFYLLGDNAPNLMREIVRKMFSLCAKAVAFSTISSWASVHEAGEFYADPLETLAFCKTLSPYVVLRHDYLPHDFTIYLYREPRR